MMKKVNKKLILGIGVLIIAVASFVWFMSQKEIGEVINTKKGDKFSISLDSNPTTGYQWKLEFNPDYILLINRTYSSSSPGLLGAGGVETFKFLALKSGRTEIKFYYLRPWEKKPPVKIKVFKIKIE